MKRPLVLLNWIIICLLVLSAAGCGRQTATPTPTSLPATATPLPSPTPKPKIDLSNLLADPAPLPLQVVSRSVEVSPQGPLEVTFDRPMDQPATEASLAVVATDGQAVDGKLSWADPRTLRFTPAKPMKGGATYLATFSQGVKSKDGVALSEPLRLKFDITSELRISQVFPAPGTTEVDNKAVITLLFNRPVVPLVAAEEQGGLPDPLSLDPSVAGRGEWVNTSVYTFHPDKPLQNGITYQAVVKAGLNAVGGGDGSALAEDFTWQFTTVAPSVDFYQAGDLINPPDGQTEIPLDAAFVIGFRQAMDPASVQAALTLSGPDGKGLALDLKWNQESTTLSIKLQKPLGYGMRYHLSLADSAQAASGGRLDKPLSWTFTSMPYPQIINTSPANGAENMGLREFTIEFASPMTIKTLADKVTFSPPLKPSSSGESSWYYNEYAHAITFYGLQPSTYYQVTIQPGMADIYGKTIATGQVVNFSTDAEWPSLYLLMPWQALYRTDGPQEFYVQYVNIDKIDITLYRLEQAEIAAYQNNADSSQLKDVVWTRQELAAGKLNQRVLKKLTLSQDSQVPLSPGVYVLAVKSPSLSAKGGDVQSRLLVVASASLTLKSSDGDALLWLTDLTSGKPIPGVSLTIYDQQFNPIGQGVTDQEGLLRLAISDPTQSAAFAMSSDAQHFAFTSLGWGSGVSPYQFGISEAYYAQPSPVRIYLYTDRPVYRPGQPVYFKGILRQDNDLAYTLSDRQKVEVTIDSYNETVYNETLTLSSFGTFDGKFVLDKDAALGSYLIQVRPAGDKDWVGALNFNVAEYRRPEFMVNVSAAPTDLLAGETLNATVKADYYSGGPVAGAQVNWTLNAAPFTFTPPDILSGYSFRDQAVDTGDYYWQPGQPDSVQVAAGQGQTDDQGVLTLSLPAELSKAGESQSMTFEATLTDLSGNTVSARAGVVVHQSAVYVGVQPGDYVGEAGKEQTFKIVAVDWQGNPQPGQKVNVDIFERRWFSVQEQDAQGSLRWVTTVKEIPVTSFTDQVADADGKLSMPFTPSQGGIYAARATALDSHGNQARASAYIWVIGSEYIPWRQTNDRSFQLVADQTSYKPGDTAQLLIASPFQGEAYALVTIERGHTRQAKVIQLTNNSTLYSLPITGDMAPNVIVMVTVVKGVDATNPRPNFKIGMLQLKVATDEQALNVTVTPDRAQAGPGDQVTYQVHVTDLKGQPVKAEVSMSLSDLATLSLSAPNSKPMMDYFYSPRSLGVRTAISIVASAEEFNAAVSPTSPEGQGGGSGGGKGSGTLGVMEVRQDFPDTAYWQAYLVTGEDGQAVVTVTLPDNLTIWRMDTRAVTLDTRVGQAIVDIASSKPLLVSPQTPRFFVVGDVTSLGAAVHNNTDQTLDVSVALDASGITLEGQAVQTVQIPARRQALVTWKGTVNADAGRVDLVFSAKAGDLQDASRPTAGTLDNQGLPVYRYEAKETVSTSGLLNAEGARVEAINLPAGMGVTQGALTLQLAPSLAASMTDGLTYLESYPYECTEQTISSFLPNVLTTRALKEAGMSSPDLEAKLTEQVNQAMQRLANRQNADGGWGWWPGMDSQVLTSAYVVQGLAEAKDAGYSINPPDSGRVNDGMLSRGLVYLAGSLKILNSLSPRQDLNQQAFVLYVLARAGEPAPSNTVQLFDARQALSLFGKAYLAQALFKIDPQDSRDAPFGFQQCRHSFGDRRPLGGGFPGLLELEHRPALDRHCPGYGHPAQSVQRLECQRRALADEQPHRRLLEDYPGNGLGADCPDRMDQNHRRAERQLPVCRRHERHGMGQRHRQHRYDPPGADFTPGCGQPAGRPGQPAGDCP
jgi:uncharacterized protein YfaS (alpha-2-macroglobulin family)